MYINSLVIAESIESANRKTENLVEKDDICDIGRIKFKSFFLYIF